jgi:hypothetical protein
MARSSLTAPGDGGTADRRVFGRSMAAVSQLLTTSLFVLAIAVAGFAVSISIARAEVAGAVPEPDTGLVLMLLALAIVLMSVLSAAAVRFAGRSRR